MWENYASYTPEISTCNIYIYNTQIKGKKNVYIHALFRLKYEENMRGGPSMH